MTGADPSGADPNSGDLRVQEMEARIWVKLLELESVTIKDRRRLKGVRRNKELDQNIDVANRAKANIVREYPLNAKLNTLEYVADEDEGYSQEGKKRTTVVEKASAEGRPTPQEPLHLQWAQAWSRQQACP